MLVLEITQDIEFQSIVECFVVPVEQFESPLWFLPAICWQCQDTYAIR